MAASKQVPKHTNRTPKKAGGKGGGSVEKYTPQQVAAAIMKARGLVALSAQVLGCGRNTVYDYINKYPEVKAALEESRELQLDLSENSLFQAVESGEAWAVCFYLKTQGKHRGYVERQEVTGKDGESLAPPTAVQFIPHVKPGSDNSDSA